MNDNQVCDATELQSSMKRISMYVDEAFVEPVHQCEEAGRGDAIFNFLMKRMRYLIFEKSISLFIFALVSSVCYSPFLVPSFVGGHPRPNVNIKN